jgi:chitinase
MKPLTDKWLTGYWAGYEAALLPPEAVDYAALTHVTVSRVVPKPDGTLTTTFDTDNGLALAKKVVGLAHAQKRKVLLMVGGDGAHDAWVAAAQEPKRAALVDALVAFAKQNGFDGLDLDWEPIDAKDEPAVLAIAKALRAKAPELLLTVPVGWAGKPRPFYGELAAVVDQVNVMTYVMAGAWEGWKTWHSSALYGETKETPSSVDAIVSAYRGAGVPTEKLGVGAGFYGQCWRGAVEGPGKVVGKATIVASDRDISYGNILADYLPLAQKGGGAKWDEQAHVPYMFFPAPAGKQSCNFISYEDPRSLADKAAYVKKTGLGGVIVWTLAQGYLPGQPPEQRNPLLRSLHAGLE